MKKTLAMIGSTKIELSKSLESHFFGSVLKKREVESLRARCENYQLESAPEWAPSLFSSYSQYFGFLSALKTRAVFFELFQYGYLDAFRGKPLELIDFGAGTLGASLGAYDFLKQEGFEISSLTAIDKDLRPGEWASELFRDFLPRHRLSQAMPTEVPSGTILIAVDVLNELTSWSMLSDLILKLPKNSMMILVEPASKSHNQKLLKYRDEILERLPSSVSLLLPCTHQMKCPALVDREWCHEERDYKAPSQYWNLVHSMGFQRSRLTFSLMVFGTQNTAFKLTDSRVVSQVLRPKGRCEKWLCSQGKRWKMGLLERHRNEENEFIYEARRGDILPESAVNPKH